MALGKRKRTEQQEGLFITADRMPRSPGYVFYQKVNRLLWDGGFDRWVEDLWSRFMPMAAAARGIPGVRR